MSTTVTDMIKMFNQPPPRPLGEKPPVARKWPPVATGSKPPPTSPKPALTHPNGMGNPRTANIGPKPFGFSNNNDDNVPKWKQDLQRNRVDSGGQQNQPSWMQKQQDDGEKHGNNSNIPLWKQKQMEREKEEESKQENIPAWKQKLNEAKRDQEENIPSWKQQLRQPKDQEKTIPQWKQRLSQAEQENKEENLPAWKQKMNQARHNEGRDESVPAWKQRLSRGSEEEFTQERDREEDNVPAWKKNTRHESTLSWSERNRQSDPATNDIKAGPPPPPIKPNFMKPKPENGMPSSDGSQHRQFSYNTMPARPKPESTASSTAPVRSSFLHSSMKDQARNNTVQPPRTPTPPSNDKGKGPPRKLPLPREVFSMPAPIKTSKPAVVHLPKGRKKNAPLPPPPSDVMSSPNRPLPPVGSRTLPPPPPSLQNSSPELPPRMPPPSRGVPPLPDRPLPSPVPKMTPTMPLPPAPNMEPDDVYDDPGEEPQRPPPVPNMPRPLLKKPSSGLIPTWEDEDDAEALYDETPDGPPPGGPPPLPAALPGFGSAQVEPIECEDMYEDVEEYMRLKRLNAEANNATTEKEKKEKEKKKKDSEKREKDIRKKFKLKGDIVPEGHGVVKESCRGSGKDLAVTAGENIEIIRMTENPKGKWLIRNEGGNYGYVDSDKISINIDELRSTFGVGGRGSAGIGPPVPPIPQEEEAIYDQTADEDLYEEF